MSCLSMFPPHGRRACLKHGRADTRPRRRPYTPTGLPRKRKPRRIVSTKAARRPACSPACMRPTRSPASSYRFSPPTTCSWITVPARSWRCLAATGVITISLSNSVCRSSTPSSRCPARTTTSPTMRARPRSSRMTASSSTPLPTRPSPRVTACHWMACAWMRRLTRSSAGWKPPASARARSATVCVTGCSAASATGASRSRSSTTRMRSRTCCRTACCRSTCLTCLTTALRPSTRRMRNPIRRHR